MFVRRERKNRNKDAFTFSPAGSRKRRRLLWSVKRGTLGCSRRHHRYNFGFVPVRLFSPKRREKDFSGKMTGTSSRSLKLAFAAAVLVCCAARACGSAIPMWEFLTRDEKVRTRYFTTLFLCTFAPSIFYSFSSSYFPLLAAAECKYVFREPSSKLLLVNWNGDS